MRAAREDSADEMCRVCREGEEVAPLYHPCKCTGSIRWVHEDCLQSWLAHSGKTKCEVCGQDFRFVRVYDKSMPQSMTVTELISGLIKVVSTEVLSWSRIVVVVFAWVGVFPVVASWTWQVYFGEWALPWENEHPVTQLGQDCVQGIFIGLVVFCLSMGALGLRDFMVANNIPLQDPLELLEPQHEGAIQPPGQGHPVRNNDAAADVALAEADQLADEALDEDPSEAARAAEYHDALAAVVHAAGDDGDMDAAMARFDEAFNALPQHDLEQDFDLPDLEPYGDTPDDTDPPATVPPAGGPWEVRPEDVLGAVQPPPPQQQQQQQPAADAGRDDHPEWGRWQGVDPDDPNFDMEGEEAADWNPNEDMPFEELVGLVGPLDALVNNLLWIVLINAAVVLLFAKLPAIVGQLVAGWVGLGVNLVWAHLFFGYCAVAVCAMIHVSLSGTWIPGRAGDDSLLSRCVLFVSVFVKVCTLLACEIILCPLLCGWWLDICSLELQQSSLRARLALVRHAPWTSTFLHWFVGTLFMHNFAAFVAVCRSIVHRRVMWFFRDPDDPEFHPLKMMLELPLIKYARRIVVINILYGSLVILLVWIPAKTLCRVWPGFMPYRFLVSHPVEMLLFTFGLPVAQNYGEIGDRIHGFVERWIRSTSTKLGISDYMLPRPGPAAGDAGDVDDTDFERPRFFRLRVALMLFLGWCTAFCIITSALSVPVWCGRMAFEWLSPEAQVHDFYSFLVGGGLLWGMGWMQRAPTQVNFWMETIQACRRHFNMAAQTAYFLLFGIGLFPLAVGLLLDLAILTPLLCPLQMTPAIALWQDWGIGVMFCKAVYELEIDGPESVVWFRDRVRAYVEDRPQDMTFAQTTLLFGPLVVFLGMLLTVPYLIGYGPLVRAVWGAKAAVEIYRLLFPLGLAFLIGRVLRTKMLGCVDSIYQTIVDDKYLIGRRLVNVGAGEDEHDLAAITNDYLVESDAEL